ncbi:penicillin-binding protein 2 [Bacillus sp. ISL-47]|uniref:peptidoglycan D,D-transpeptidase FtsI family protein n=1 Tax=Bacillus sp. ISL-47 TaxID=2819130 RepID=UPI001BE5E272|nr:penicillin-binding transpeptidase domain-containing protein [Bacillus sp. ISL-47]MBT2688011.1 penicillin-binding protein 2 [Bacillus sp. ISL-47]MBT2707979.1 penicillin-binding protein 2 [Pseudomonas sp. ISL-84]
MWRKRAVGWLIISFAGLFLLVGRLIQLQLISTEHFTDRGINLLEASVRQRSQEMVIDTGRGNFLDRNGKPLTHKDIPVLILFPFLAKMDWDIERVSEITGASEYSLRYSVENAKEPFAFGKPEPLQLTEEQMEKINALKIPGVFAVEKKYNLLESPAAQLIGITGENQNLVKERYPDKELSISTMVGVTGMEKSFDEFLLPEGASKLVYHVDATGGPLFGINVKYVEPANPFYPVNIKTTLDYDLQMMAENFADQHGIKKGGIVLLDIETNTVLAMVSRPAINKDNPFGKESGGAVNQMIKQQIMGSVFKTVVAAAAIDHGLDDPARQFDCSKKINGQPDLKYQHGMLNFNDSFARSCNNTFATVANELKDIDSGLLEVYAERLSLTGPVTWQGDIYHFNDFRQLQDEEKGRVFLSEDAKKDRNYVALTGIGQHEVRATPLAVANMMATIARGGQKEMVRVASEIEYKNSTSLLEFKKQKLTGEMVAPYTAMKLQKLLREVVINEDGTGRWFRELPYEVAGKSGTAETGRIVGGKQLHNKWFAGYFPYKNPKYALVTVNLGVTEDTGGVNPLFADLVKGIYNFNHKEEVPSFGSADS